MIKRLKDDTPAARLLGALAWAVLRYRRWILISQGILFVIAIVYTVSFLEFNTRRSDLVGPNQRYHENYMRLRQEFPTQDDLVVLVESEDPEKNRQFVERLGAKLEQEPKSFKDVFYKGDLKMLGSKALLFVPEADLVQLKDTLRDYLPFIRNFAQTTNLVSLFDMVNAQFRTGRRERDAESESMIKALPALQRIITQATATLHRPGVPPSPGITALFNAGEKADQQVYITFGEGNIFLVTAQAPRAELNRATLERLRLLVEETRAEVPGLNIGLTGEPVLEIDEMQQSQKDTTLASVVCLVLCALIFIYGYQETGRPLKATVCLVVGVAYTMAFTTAVVGHLNILTITFVPILMGLAIDFGVHLISRYEEELRHGKTEEQALTKGLVYTGRGIFSGAFTAAGSFLAMSLTDFRGIQEMGIICGGGLLICLIPMLTLLPALLMRGRQNIIDHEQGDLLDKRARIENIWLQRPVSTMVVVVMLCALSATQIHRVYFDYNLLNMQSAGLPAVEFEKKLINSASKSVLFGAVVATNLSEAIELQAKLEELPSVSSVDSITRFLTEEQSHKLAVVGEIKNLLARLSFQEPDSRPVDITELSRVLYSFYGYLGAAADEIGQEKPELAEQFFSLRQAVSVLRKDMLRDPELSRNKLATFQQALFNDLRDTFEALRTQDDRAPLRVQDLPETLRNRFVGVTGKHLLMVYPKGDVWQREYQSKFVADLRTVDPDATGTPVQLYEYTTLLKNSYQEAAKYSLAAIVVLVFIQFRSLLSVFLALLPVGLGSLWTAGLMGATNLPFNPANIMTLPLVIGIGVTNGIHILNRYAEEQAPSILARSTGKAVLVSGLTTIAGFGSLVLAKHQGIQSLGWIMSLGVGACMIAGLTALPAILNLMAKNRRPSGENA